jgi:hypothetical protein
MLSSRWGLKHKSIEYCERYKKHLELLGERTINTSQTEKYKITVLHSPWGLP